MTKLLAIFKTTDVILSAGLSKVRGRESPAPLQLAVGFALRYSHFFGNLLTQIEALQSLKSELSGLISSWELKLASTTDGQQARLLEELVSPNVSFRDSRKTRLNARRKPKESE